MARELVKGYVSTGIRDGKGFEILYFVKYGRVYACDPQPYSANFEGKNWKETTQPDYWEFIGNYEHPKVADEDHEAYLAYCASLDRPREQYIPIPHHDDEI